MNAIAKYRRRVAKVDSLLCVGLDSRLERIPERFRQEELPLFAFNRSIIKATHPWVCAFKPNIAFYEAQGEPGLMALRRTILWLRERHPDILTICDAKRGDIGSTSAAYASAIFDDLGFDAVTLNPWLGRDALTPFLERSDHICIILCRTSNPGAGEFQDLPVGGRPLWQEVALAVSERWNEQWQLHAGDGRNAAAGTGAGAAAGGRHAHACAGHWRSGRRGGRDPARGP